MHIDWWTLALQTVNVLVLVWLLARFLFRPVMDAIARRRAEANKLLADASASRERAERAEAEAVRRQRALDADAEGILASAHARAETESAALLRRAAEDAARQAAQAAAAIARERDAMQNGVLEQAGKLAVAIARRLLARLRPDVATAAALETLPAELAGLSQEVRDQIAKAGQPIEVVTATQLGEREQAACRALLATALNTEPVVTFRADPELIAGVELHAAHTLLRNSWRADLDRMAREVNRDDGHAAAVG